MELAPDLAKKLVEFVQEMAWVHSNAEPGTPAYSIQFYRQASELAKELPDPDIEEARQRAIALLSCTVVSDGFPSRNPQIQRIKRGEGDTNSYVSHMLAAIKRGREIERGAA